jgi:hypothetical protein
MLLFEHLNSGSNNLLYGGGTAECVLTGKTFALRGIAGTATFLLTARKSNRTDYERKEEQANKLFHTIPPRIG